MVKGGMSIGTVPEDDLGGTIGGDRTLGDDLIGDMNNIWCTRLGQGGEDHLGEKVTSDGLTLNGPSEHIAINDRNNTTLSSTDINDQRRGLSPREPVALEGGDDY